MNTKEFSENNDGVHLMYGEYSICGDSFDIGTYGGEEVGDLERTKKKVVTCPECIDLIEYCRNVKTKRQK